MTPVGKDNIKTNMPREPDPPRPNTTSLSTKLVCGAVAGVIGTLLIYPLDSIKTRLQNSAVKRLSIREVYGQATKNAGFVGLYRGLVPNLGMRGMRQPLNRQWE